jgi:hypothetical protein
MLELVLVSQLQALRRAQQLAQWRWFLVLLNMNRKQVGQQK